MLQFRGSWNYQFIMNLDIHFLLETISMSKYALIIRDKIMVFLKKIRQQLSAWMVFEVKGILNKSLYILKLSISSFIYL